MTRVTMSASMSIYIYIYIYKFHEFIYKKKYTQYTIHTHMEALLMYDKCNRECQYESIYVCRSYINAFTHMNTHNIRYIHTWRHSFSTMSYSKCNHECQYESTYTYKLCMDLFTFIYICIYIYVYIYICICIYIS